MGQKIFETNQPTKIITKSSAWCFGVLFFTNTDPMGLLATKHRGEFKGDQGPDQK